MAADGKAKTCLYCSWRLLAVAMGKITHYYVIYWFLFLNAGCPGRKKIFVAQRAFIYHTLTCWLVRLTDHQPHPYTLSFWSSPVSGEQRPAVRQPKSGSCTWIVSNMVPITSTGPNRTEYVAVNHENIWKPLEKRTIIQQKWCESKKLPNYPVEKLPIFPTVWDSKKCSQSTRIVLESSAWTKPQPLGWKLMEAGSMTTGWCLVMIFMEKLRGPLLDVYEIFFGDRFQTIRENSKVGSSY